MNSEYGIKMNMNDILNSSGDEANVSMENMDVLSNDNPELLTSEFFDSVFSMENIDDGLFNFEDDVHLSSDSSSHMDEVLSPQSFYSESEKSSISTEGIDDTGSIINGIDDTGSIVNGIDDTGSLINGIDNFDDPILMSFLDPVQNVQVEERPIIIKSPIKPTKILIQNPNNKKVITKPIISQTQLKKAPKLNKPQILKVHSVSNNGRPVLLPLSVKSIKILNANTDVTSLTNSLKRRKIETHTIQSIEEDDTNVVSSTNNQYPALSLTNEEKRLLTKEGIQLPTHHPLTKNEERELKRIRRKIRNKISAQDSRKRKKEYVDGLEERVKRGSEENKNLLQRVKELQRQNRNLMAHVSKLQALICKSTSSKATPSTCLMVVLLSALLVSLPNLRLFEKQQLSTEQEQVAIRRSLLSSQTIEEEGGLNMDEFLVFKDEDSELDAKFGEDALDIENATEKDLSKILEEMGKKYEGLAEKNSSEKMSVFNRVIQTVKSFLDKDKPELFGKVDYGGFHNKQGFIEPDIDDLDDPPSKRMKYTMDEIQFKDPVPGLQDVNVIRNEKIVTVNTNTFTIANSKDK